MTLDGRPFALETAPGVFSPRHVDLGTTVVLDTAGAPPAGEVLDLGCGWGPIALTADDVPADARFDAIWSNPPIRIGITALHEVLTARLPRLVPGGEAWLVVQRHLGADSLARWISERTDAAGNPWGEIAKVRSAKGFRVLRVVRR